MSRVLSERIRKKTASWLLLAFFANFLSPFIVQASPSSTATIQTREGKALLCTSRGLQWVDVNQLLEKTTNSNEHTESHCFFCLLTKKYADSLAILPSVWAFYSNISRVSQRNNDFILVIETLANTAEARAPPLYHSI